MNKIMVVCLLVVIALAGCNPRGSANTADLQVTLTADSMEVGESRLSITVLSEQLDPITDATVELRGDMSHAGMVPVLATATHQGDGLYTSEDFEFTMAGDWFVEVTVTQADGTVSTETVQLPGVAGEMKGDMEHDHSDHADHDHSEAMDDMDKDSMDKEHADHMHSGEHSRDEMKSSSMENDHEHAHSHEGEHETMELPENGTVPTLSVRAENDGGWELVIETNYELQAPTGEYEDGVGHLHVYVNEGLHMMVHKTRVSLEDYGAGEHSVVVTLASNDHKELTIDGEPVKATTTFVVEDVVAE